MVKSQGVRAYPERRCGSGTVGQAPGFVHDRVRRIAVSNMTSQVSPPHLTPTSSASTWVMAALIRSAEPTGFESRATRIIPPSSNGVVWPSMRCSRGNGRGLPTEDTLCGRYPLLQTPAVLLPTAGARPQAHQEDRAAAVATGDRRARNRGVRPRLEPQRRLPRGGQRPGCAQRAVPLQQQIRRHHRLVHRSARPARDPMAPVDEVHRLDLPQVGDRPAGRVHRPQGRGRTAHRWCRGTSMSYCAIFR